MKEIQKEYPQWKFSCPKKRHLRLIALDEITIGSGHGYLTMVLDLETGAVVFVT